MTTLHPKSCLTVSSIQSVLPTSNSFADILLKQKVTPVDFISTPSSKFSFSTLLLKQSEIQIKVPDDPPTSNTEFLFGLPKIYTKEQKNHVLIQYNEQKLPYLAAQYAVLEDYFQELLGQLSTSTKSNDSKNEYFISQGLPVTYAAFNSDLEKYKQQYTANVNEIIAKGIFSKTILERSPNV